MRPRRVAALALHVLRASLRSRFILAMLVLLAGIVAVLPGSLRGDGTVEGTVRVLFTWTLTLIVTLLSAAVLWAGCAAASSDRGEQRAAALRVTPVRAFEQWLGEWLGLVLMSGLLLAGVLGLLLVQVRRSDIPESALRPHWRLEPAESGLLEHAHAILLEAVDAGRIGPDADSDALLEQVVDRLRTEHLALSPGDTHQWRFEIPRRAFRPDESALLRIEFTSPLGSADEFTGRCRVLDAAGRQLAEYRVTPDDRRQVEFELAGSLLAATPRVAVLFEHLGAAETSAVLLHAGAGATLRLPIGRFTTNLALAGLAVWSLLAFLAALGLSSGAMFSLPVAVFVASSVTLLGLVSHTQFADLEGCAHAHHHGDESRLQAIVHTLEHVAEHAFAVLASPSAPLIRAAPLDRLGDRVRIDPRAVLHGLLQFGIAFSLLIGALGALAFDRREIP